jgi:hypothetical protein
MIRPAVLGIVTFIMLILVVSFQTSHMAYTASGKSLLTGLAVWGGFVVSGCFFIATLRRTLDRYRTDAVRSRLSWAVGDYNTDPVQVGERVRGQLYRSVVEPVTMSPVDGAESKVNATCHKGNEWNAPGVVHGKWHHVDDGEDRRGPAKGYPRGHEASGSALVSTTEQRTFRTDETYQNYSDSELVALLRDLEETMQQKSDEASSGFFNTAEAWRESDQYQAKQVANQISEQMSEIEHEINARQEARRRETGP